jgi:hypothetical protein
MSGVSVEVSAQKVTVPCLCPCCCGVADTALAISFTRVTGGRSRRETTRGLDFPYCSRCVRHSRWWSAAQRTAGAVLAAGVAAVLIAGVAGGLLAAAIAAVGSVVLAAISLLALRGKARASCCPSCSGPGPAVTYHAWADHVQTFSFASRRYAAAFAEQNEESLVNVTPHLYQLVEQRRVSVSAPPPVRTVPLWPHRLDRARALLDHVVRIDPRAIRPDGMVKRPGRAS